MKVLLLIMNCDKYRFKARKQNWLKNITKEIQYFHVIGNIEKCKDNNYLLNKENKILYVKTLDDYNSLPHKVITSFQYGKDNNYDYIFKTDDDQCLKDINFFDNLIKNLKENNYYYGGRILEVKKHKSTYYKVHNCLPKNLILEKTKYCPGRFYFLKKEAYLNLIEKTDDFKKRYIEDHSIGYFLDNKYKENILSLDVESFFNDY